MSDEMIEQVADAIHDMVEELGMQVDRIGDALKDDNGEPWLASLPAIASGLQAVANAVTPLGDAPGQDAGGGYVGSLTEAVMGISGGLFAIAGAIERLADAIRPQDGNQ